MTHKQPAAFGSPVFRTRAPVCSSGVGRSPPDLQPATAPPDLQPPPQPRQISGCREACPPARRPRCELRSARRLEARPGPPGLAAASNRAACHAVIHRLARHRRHMRYKTRPVHPNHHANGTKLAQHTQNTHKSAIFRKQGEYCHADCSKPAEPGEFCLAHQHHCSRVPIAWPSWQLCKPQLSSQETISCRQQCVY